MRKTGLLWKVAAVLVPTVVVGCAGGDEGAQSSAPPSADAVEAGYKQLGDQLPRKDLAVRSATADPDGTKHVRFDQLFKGVPVFEGEAITHIRPNGKVDVTDALRPIKPNLDVTPNITQTEAIAKARTASTATGTVTVTAATLMVLPNGDHDPHDRLAWYVRISAEGADVAQWDTFVDAHTGKIVMAYDTLTTGTHGHTAWSGKVDLEATETTAGDPAVTTYGLTDSHENITCDMNQSTSSSACAGPMTTTTTETISESLGDTDGDTIEEFHDVVYGLFGDGQHANRATAGADAHFGMQMTLDFYAQVLGRNGIDNNGTKTRSRVHYGSAYQNAFWQDSCYCMTFGDGGTTLHPLTTLDIAGHEMSHGVMAFTAKLTYRGESGGLNESNSDIFGTMVEFYAAEQQGWPTNTAVADVPDWKIGERLYKSDPNKSLRHMDNPKLDGKSAACWTKTIKGLDVHYSSGPNNHMFYLLASTEPTKSACTGAFVTGVGRDKAARIWYRAVTNYLTAASTYANARVAAVNAATDLYGADSAEVTAVKAAYTAIGVK